MMPKNKTIVVLGSGPIRIGQGIEFDYASVQCVWNLKKLGYEVAIINNNPETVSTDFDTADRLYFEPLTPVDVMNVLAVEKPIGVVVAFGGGTAIKLAKFLDEQGIKILGTSADAIDLAEDRERFEELCDRLNIHRPKGLTIFTEVEALEAAEKIGYPVLMRPSYVLGGQNMIIARNSADVKEYMKIILRAGIENPVLIDKYMEGKELEVDCICDGEDVLIPGIMEHIERTGIHSGDSIAVYPGTFEAEIEAKIVQQSRDLALALGTKGLVNIQYLIYDNDLYIIEANPRSSRTVPYLSKVTGVPMIELATRAMLGERVRDMGFGTGLYRKPAYFAVKVPVFSFEKLMDVDTHLGPEMKSTGEAIGYDKKFTRALYKALQSSGMHVENYGTIFVTLADKDKEEALPLIRSFYNLGFNIESTKGTGDFLKQHGIRTRIKKNISEGINEILESIRKGYVSYVINTSSLDSLTQENDGFKIRRASVENNVTMFTSFDTVRALLEVLEEITLRISTI